MTTIYNEKKCGEEAMKHRLDLTPGTPRFIAMRGANEEDKLPAKEHATYRSRVGTLLYLTKHSRPDLCNVVRELSKTMDRPARIHLKEMYRIIRYVLKTRKYGLKFYPKRCSWIIQAFGDSDFAGDRETRRRAYGYFVHFCGIPIAWKIKGMRSVVLSTTEGEYIALSEVVKETKFIIQLLKTMNVNVDTPITIQENLDRFHAIHIALGRPATDLDIFHNWFSSGTPVNYEPMHHLELMTHIQCHLLGRYILLLQLPSQRFALYQK